MSRQRKRACLEQGLCLDLNLLIRKGTLQVGWINSNRRIGWGSPPIATAALNADLLSHSGWLEVSIGDTTQRFELICESRNFGGFQRYFICPTTGRKASVLWRPPGADEFRSRLGWGNSVGYITQIGSWTERAHRAKAKIKNILLGNLNPNDWDLPPKPKWMRLRTYKKYEEKFDLYDGALALGWEGKFAMPKRKRSCN